MLRNALILSLLLLFSPLSEVTPPEGYFRETQWCYWDPPTTQTDGSPIALAELAQAELGVWVAGAFAPGIDPARTLGSLDPAGTGVTFWSLFTGLPDGSYTIAVRVVDRGGNWSGWSNTVTGVLDRIPPNPPGGCRCQ